MLAVDVALDGSGAVWECQSIEDGGVVAFEPGDEAVEVWQLFVGVDGGQPGVEVLAMQTGEHLRERADMTGSGLKVRTCGQDLLQRDLLVGIQIVGRCSIQEVIRRTLGTVGLAGGAAPRGRKGAR
jgi:hypothetical protein